MFQKAMRKAGQPEFRFWVAIPAPGIHPQLPPAWAIPGSPADEAELQVGRILLFENEMVGPALENVNTSFTDLGDFYAWHVRSIFWRLRGWTDDRIEDWYRAHTGHQIERKEVQGIQWFEKGPWVDVDDLWVGRGLRVSTMEELNRVIFGMPTSARTF